MTGRAARERPGQGSSLHRRAGRIAAISIAVVLAGATGVAVVMRMVPDDPATWHADPLAGARTGQPNDYLVAPAGLGPALPDAISATHPLAAADLMARLDAAALAEPRTRRLAGSPDELWATYVQRSALFGFPDYVSARAVEVSGGSALAVWSRARFGVSDMGVNRARVERWLAASAP